MLFTEQKRVFIEKYNKPYTEKILLGVVILLNAILFTKTIKTVTYNTIEAKIYRSILH